MDGSEAALEEQIGSTSYHPNDITHPKVAARCGGPLTISVMDGSGAVPDLCMVRCSALSSTDMAAYMGSLEAAATVGWLLTLSARISVPTCGLQVVVKLLMFADVRLEACD